MQASREQELQANLKREEAYKREHKPAAALDRQSIGSVMKSIGSVMKIAAEW